MKHLVYLIFALLMISAVNSIYVYPEELRFEELSAGEFYEKNIKVSTDSDTPVQIIISPPSSMKNWFVFEPDSMIITKDEPAEIKVILYVPNTASLGTHETFLIINTISENNQITGQVSSADTLKTTININKIQTEHTNTEQQYLSDSTNWIMLIIWTVLLVFVTWTISNKEKKKK